jgi:Ca-activated chloride channel family protein
MTGIEGLSIAGVQFLRPLWLLGLPALPLLAWLWRRRAARADAWREHVDAHLLPHLLEAGAEGRARWGMRGVLLGLGLALLALAGPAWRQVEQPLWQTRAPLVVALDLSSATLAGDLPPSRLAQARAKIAQLLQQRKGGQVALVAYAEQAYTVAPLTDDVANIALFLDALDPDVMPTDSWPEDGSRASAAIAWSQGLLRQAGFGSGDILLLTGEADADARSAAADSAAAGYRVSVLGLGTAAGAAYRRPDGSIGQARLEAPLLRGVAGAGDGRFETVQPDARDLQALGVLDPLRAGARATQGEKRAAWQDEGFWLLPPLLLLAAFAFRRGGALAVLALCLWLPLAPAPAQAQDGTLWRRADQQAHARMQQGQRAYRKGDFAAAAQAYGRVDSADGAYNLGNALAKQGRYEEAIDAYERALARQPGMADAIANREAVRRAMQRKPPPGANRNQPNPQDRRQGQSQSRDGQGQPGKGDADPRQAQQRPPRQPGQQQGQDARGEQDAKRPPTPADQRAADAAQRQRMQRELQAQRETARRADKGQDVEGRPDRAEQAAQRERSIATEALLRRVPDDPGALLRAKFQLEYERRQARGER